MRRGDIGVEQKNSAFNAMGELRASDEVNACTAKATAAGLTPDDKDNAVAQGTAKGATAGALRDKPNQTYRHFVQRCLRDKGLDVIGWN
jgi:outer membrane lipoprotein SlyB